MPNIVPTSYIPDLAQTPRPNRVDKPISRNNPANAQRDIWRHQGVTENMMETQNGCATSGTVGWDVVDQRGLLNYHLMHFTNVSYFLLGLDCPLKQKFTFLGLLEDD